MSPLKVSELFIDTCHVWGWVSYLLAHVMSEGEWAIYWHMSCLRVSKLFIDTCHLLRVSKLFIAATVCGCGSCHIPFVYTLSFVDWLCVSACYHEKYKKQLIFLKFLLIFLRFLLINANICWNNNIILIGMTLFYNANAADNCWRPRECTTSSQSWSGQLSMTHYTMHSDIQVTYMSMYCVEDL